MVAARVGYPAARRGSHYGLIEVEVFLWPSLACAVSQVLHQILSLSLSTLNYNHPSYICNYSGLPLFRGPGGFSPFHLAHYYAPASPALMKMFKVVFSFIKTLNCCELFAIILNWPVKSWVYSEIKSVFSVGIQRCATVQNLLVIWCLTTRNCS